MFLEKVTVSQSSWHYRWLQSYRSWGWCPPIDFCTYFWLLVLQATIFVGVSAVAGFLLAAYIAWWLVVPWEAFICTMVVLGGMVGLVGLIAFVAYMTDFGGKEKFQASLVWQYVKAKKNKYCPFVEYTT